MTEPKLEEMLFGTRNIDNSFTYREEALAINPNYQGNNKIGKLLSKHANSLNRTTKEVVKDLLTKIKKQEYVDRTIEIKPRERDTAFEKSGISTVIKMTGAGVALTGADYLSRKYLGVGVNDASQDYIVIPAMAAFGMAAHAINTGGDIVSNKLEELLKKTHLTPGQVGGISSVSTSLPELFSSLKSSLGGATTNMMALPNFVGSNIFNETILAYAAARYFNFTEFTKAQKEDIKWMLGLTALVSLSAYTGGNISPVEGAIITLTGVEYVRRLLGERKTDEQKEKSDNNKDNKSYSHSILKNTIIYSAIAGGIGLGILALRYGADASVDSLYTGAVALGAAPGIVSLVLLALSTSLPELAVTNSNGKKPMKNAIEYAEEKYGITKEETKRIFEGDKKLIDEFELQGININTLLGVEEESRYTMKELIYDTIVKSNIFNMAFAGVTALATNIKYGEGVPYPQDQLSDLGMVLAAEAILAGLVLGNQEIGKKTGLGMIVGYGLYIAYNVLEKGAM